MDSNGNLFGTTNTGGANQVNSVGAGVAYELIPNDTKTAYTETVNLQLLQPAQDQVGSGTAPVGAVCLRTEAVENRPLVRGF